MYFRGWVLTNSRIIRLGHSITSVKKSIRVFVLFKILLIIYFFDLECLKLYILDYILEIMTVKNIVNTTTPITVTDIELATDTEATVEIIHI